MFDSKPKQHVPAEKAYADLVYSLAQQAAIDAMVKDRDRLKTLTDAWEKDAAEYSFSAKRFGDFLNVFISRAGKKYAGALNLGRVQEIRLEEGYSPDLKGALEFNVCQERDGESNGNIYGYSWSDGEDYGFGADNIKPPQKGYHYKVTAASPYDYGGRFMVHVATEHMHMPASFSSGGNYHGLVVEGVSRPAVDDVLHLTGIATCIFAPAGKGAYVRDVILTEIAKGHEPQQYREKHHVA